MAKSATTHVRMDPDIKQEAADYQTPETQRAWSVYIEVFSLKR